MKRSLVALAATLLLGLNYAAAQEPATPQTSTPPSYCNPCLYYGGDFEPRQGYATAYPNENTVYVPNSSVYAEFGIPSGQVWEIKGLFTNDLSNNGGVLDPKQAAWSVSSGMSTGDPGTVIASGTATPTVQPTGRSVDTFVEYTVRVGIPQLTLGAGEYWLQVQPQCTNTGDDACTTAEFSISNTNGTNAYGPPQAPNASFENSDFLGADYLPLCQFDGGGGTCRWVSAGVIGYRKK